MNLLLHISYQSSSGTATRYYVGTLELIKEPGDASPRLVRANPLRYVDPTGEDIWKINS